MAHKTYIDGGNKAIAYHNDHEPCKAYKDGELLTDISYTTQSVTGKSSVTYESEYKKNLLNIEIQGNTNQNGIPTLDTPIPINNTGDNGIDVKVRGINLFPEELLLTNSKVIKVGDEYQFLGYPCTYNSYVGNEELVVAFKNTIKPDVKYTICSQFSSRNSASSAGAFQLRDSVSGGNLIYGVYNNSNVGAIKLDVFSLTQEQLDSIQNIWIYGTTQANIDAGYKPTIGRFMILEGEYTLDTLPPFEPYFEPQTVTIPTTLCGIDGYNDSLTVDWLNKTVKKNTKILYARVSDLIDTGNAIIAPSELDGITYYAIAINDVPMWIGSIDGGETASNYYCTHCLTYHNSQIETGTLICELYNGYDGTDNTSLWFYYIEQSTVEDFRAWADENNVMIAYILKYESVEDISSDLLSLTDYTQNQTNIIEIIPNNDVNASSLTVEYAKWEGDVND